MLQLNNQVIINTHASVSAKNTVLNLQHFPDFNLVPENPWHALFMEKGITRFQDACRYVSQLKYGRISDVHQPALVLHEQRGTCSSKHQLLALLATGYPDIQLRVGIYLMQESNTPGVGNVLSAHGLTEIPEAHCYLEYHNEVFDFTMPHKQLEFQSTLQLSKVIENPLTLLQYKTAFHKAYLHEWIQSRQIPFTADATWQIREKCIAALSM